MELIPARNIYVLAVDFLLYPWILRRKIPDAARHIRLHDYG